VWQTVLLLLSEDAHGLVHFQVAFTKQDRHFFHQKS
jgi:hypothetical protein